MSSESYVIDKHIYLRIIHNSLFTNVYLICTIKKTGLKAYSCSLNLNTPENTVSKIMAVREQFLKKIENNKSKNKAKNILGYEGKYKIYNDGRVFSYHTNKFLKHNKDGGGYLNVVLCKNGKRTTTKIHRLVAIHFIGNLDQTKNQVDHIDHNKTNNDVSNLRWVSHSINQRNRLIGKNNTSGYAGITISRNGKYRACYRANGKTIEKTFKNLDEAIAYRNAGVDKHYQRINI